jgi:hypothetical protein
MEGKYIINKKYTKIINSFKFDKKTTYFFLFFLFKKKLKIILFIKKKKAVELTSESEPEDLEGISEIEDIKVDD